MRQVLILGAGGLGRELFWWAQEANLKPIGFIDDCSHALDTFEGYAPILGSIDTAPLTHPILCGIGQNALRQICIERLLARGATFCSCIHPQAKVIHATLGEGAVLAPFSYIGANAHVGRFLFMQCGAVLGHDVRAGDFLRLDTSAFVGGGATLGNGVTLYTGAKVMPGKTIGHRATLGAGSVLLSNLPPQTTAFGVPAQKL